MQLISSASLNAIHSTFFTKYYFSNEVVHDIYFIRKTRVCNKNPIKINFEIFYSQKNAQKYLRKILA